MDSLRIRGMDSHGIRGLWIKLKTYLIGLKTDILYYREVQSLRIKNVNSLKIRDLDHLLIRDTDSLLI